VVAEADLVASVEAAAVVVVPVVVGSSGDAIQLRLHQ